MSSTVTVTVDDVTVKGPFKNQTNGSTYHALTILADGTEYVKFQNDETQPVDIGDKVAIHFQSTKGKKGEFNKILNLEKSLETHTTSKTSTKPTTNKVKTFDTDGARKGMITKAAIDLAIARKGTNTTLSDLLKGVDDVIEVSNTVEQKLGNSG